MEGDDRDLEGKVVPAAGRHRGLAPSRRGLGVWWQRPQPPETRGCAGRFLQFFNKKNASLCIFLLI